MFELIRANKRRSIALIAGFVLVVAVVGARVDRVILVSTLVTKSMKWMN